MQQLLMHQEVLSGCHCLKQYHCILVFLPVLVDIEEIFSYWYLSKNSFFGNHIGDPKNSFLRGILPESL